MLSIMLAVEEVTLVGLVTQGKKVNEAIKSINTLVFLSPAI